MTHQTKGIVLKTVKYGETSLVVTVFTRMFGIQTYLVNGVRKQQQKGSKAIMLQPSALLDMEVYHNEMKSLQRIKECEWSYLYEHLLSDVVKNSIATFLLELLHKTLKQPEPNDALFDFCEDAFQYLDTASAGAAANFALYFSLHLPQFFGFNIQHTEVISADEAEIYLDLMEGNFVYQKPQHHHFIQGEIAMLTMELLKAMHPSELEEFRLNKDIRRNLLTAYQQYYSLHIQDFGQMKTWKVLQEVLG